jgi:hypothetical protein
LDYRRKKQWDIFSWASTILLSVVGGVFALPTRGQQPRLPWDRGAVSFAALMVAAFAQVWIRYHWQYELDLAKTIYRIPSVSQKTADCLSAGSRRADFSCVFCCLVFSLGWLRSALSQTEKLAAE